MDSQSQKVIKQITCNLSMNQPWWGTIIKNTLMFKIIIKIEYKHIILPIYIYIKCYFVAFEKLILLQ